MRPTYLSLHNFKSHADSSVDLANVHVAAVTGTNGAGKSTILDAIVYALYGPDGLGLGKRADTVIREGETTAAVVLTFIAGDATYRVTRTRKSTGKTVLDLARVGGDEPRSLTRGTVKDTQAAIEALVGCSAETFLQAVYVGQGDASRFAKATPGERRDTLSQALDLDQYPPLQQQARDQLRAVTLDTTATTEQIERLETGIDADATPEQRQVLVDALNATHEQRAAKGVELEQARKAHADARVAAAAGEQARALATDRAEAAARAKADAAAAGMACAAARTAAEANTTAAAAHADLVAQQPTLVDDAPLEQAAEARRVDLAAVETEMAAAQERRTQLAAAASRAGEIDREHAAALAAQVLAQGKLAAVRDADEAHCPTCTQALGVDARAATLRTIEQEVAAAEEKIRVAASALLGQQQVVRLSQAVVDGASDLAPRLAAARDASNMAVAALSEARKSNTRHHELATQIAAASAAAARQAELDAAVTAADARHVELHARSVAAEAAAEEARRNAAGDEATERIAALELAVTGHEATLAGLNASIESQERDLAAMRERLKHAETARERAASGRAHLETLQSQARVWETLSRAFGREGIPSTVIRHARPQIEADVNASLERVGAPYRIRIDLERDTKAGTVQETLDITILAGGHERPFDLLSGGEQYRVNIALRCAIAKVLANRSGKRIDTLVLDEPEGLDAEGFSALADLIKHLGNEFGLVLTVSHTDGLEAVCDTILQVEKIDGASRVTVAA